MKLHSTKLKASCFQGLCAERWVSYQRKPSEAKRIASLNEKEEHRQYLKTVLAMLSIFFGSTMLEIVRNSIRFSLELVSGTSEALSEHNSVYYDVLQTPVYHRRQEWSVPTHS